MVEYNLYENGRVDVIVRNGKLEYTSYDSNGKQVFSGPLCSLHRQDYTNVLDFFCFIQQAIQKNSAIAINPKASEELETKVEK